MRTQIHAWLDRRHPLPTCFASTYAANTRTEHELLWISIDERIPLHEIAKNRQPSIADAVQNIRSYVSSAISVLGSDQVEEIGDKNDVIKELGEPPERSKPIYIITTEEAGIENVVYVGKTVTNGRFEGGHLAAIKLHNPAYRNAEKYVYRCSITLSLRREWFALEWVGTPSIAEQILDDVESRLIYHFQPPLNTQKKSADLAVHKAFAVHIQNSYKNLAVDSFLNDWIIDPH